MDRATMLLGLLAFSAWAQPVREASSASLLGGVMPAFYNGYMYSGGMLRGNMTLFAPDGHVVTALAVRNGTTRIMSIAIDSDGTIALSWSDLQNAAIEVRDAYGTLLRTIDTGRFLAAHLSFGIDHSLWGLGWQRAATTSSRPDSADYGIVRKYSLEGKQIGAYLQRSMFKPGLEPGMDEWQRRRITVTDDRVGIEAVSGNVGNEREWVELDLNGNVVGRWALDPSNYSGVALTRDNRVYVQRFDRGARVKRVYRLNRVLSVWEPVDAPNLTLYGSDERELVFAQWPDHHVMQMSWFQLP